jgi:hypothetical protein
MSATSPGAPSWSRDWSVDLTGYCERLVERLADRGVAHPEAAAVALAVRGHRGVDQRTHAAELGLTSPELAVIEAGQVPYPQLPDRLVERARAVAGLDLSRLEPRGRPSTRAGDPLRPRAALPP